MTTPEPIRLQLELAFEDDLPVGRVFVPAGHIYQFSGWLGLAAAIEGATEKQPPSQNGP